MSGVSLGAAGAPRITARLTTIMALACGAIVANLYYAQPLVGPISGALHLPVRLSGLVVTLAQLGYGAGLLLVVPLGDMLENRRLVAITLTVAGLGLAGVALSDSTDTFLVASFVVGFGSVATQVLVPLAAHLAPDAQRGRVIGNVMGGLIAGIMLARPVSSLVAASFGWRTIFYASSLAMLLLALVLRRVLPVWQPKPGPHYGQILASMLRMLRLRTLQRRIAYQMLAFAGFNLFWTAVPLMLASRFGLTQRGIALFALAGAGGALAAPLAGRLADRGLARPVTLAVPVLMAACFLVSRWGFEAGSLLVLGLAAILIDACVQTNQVVSQRVIYELQPHARGRITGVYMALVFVGGAAGSALGSFTVAEGGWPLTALAGAGLGLVSLALVATERPAHTLNT